MHDLLNDSDLSSVHLMAPCIIGCPSWWTSTALQIEQSCISKSLTLKMSTPPHCQSAKQLGFYFQDQDSSSTQSTCQSYPGVASVGESNPYGQSVLSVNTRCNGSPGKLEEVHKKSALLKGTQDCVFPPQVDYRQQYACVPLSHPEPYYHGLLSTYGPLSMPQMMGVASPRVPLPLDLTQDEPIYVNAKQYNAILRRRQYRAKLEAQNKVSKNRKPYLHESRHLHALKRARGSGGRFLNMKKLAESALNATRSEQDVSRSSRLQTTTKMLESELYHPTEEYKEAPTTNFCSDITTVSNNASNLQQQETRFSGYPSLVGRPGPCKVVGRGCLVGFSTISRSSGEMLYDDQ